MSERKTTEIKLRVSPDEKTSWQVEAERQGIGLSELIRSCVQATILAAEWNRQLDGTALVNNAIATLSDTEGEDSSIAPKTIPIGTVVSNGVVGERDVVRDITTGEIITVTAVPTYGEADLVTRAAQPQIQRGSHQVGTKPLSALRQPKPWTFEARKGD